MATKKTIKSLIELTELRKQLEEEEKKVSVNNPVSNKEKIRWYLDMRTGQLVKEFYR